MSRKFRQLHIGQQLDRLLSTLGHSTKDVLNGCNDKTDVVGVACQYGGSYGLDREDFDRLKHLTLGQIVEMFDKAKPKFDGRLAQLSLDNPERGRITSQRRQAVEDKFREIQKEFKL